MPGHLSFHPSQGGREHDGGAHPINEAAPVSDQPGPIPNATVIADAVRSGRLTARAGVEHSLARIARHDPALNAFTVVRADQARAEADAQRCPLTAFRVAEQPRRRDWSWSDDDVDYPCERCHRERGQWHHQHQLQSAGRPPGRFLTRGENGVVTGVVDPVEDSGSGDE